MSGAVNLILIAVGIVLIIAGFVSLAAGSITLAPWLLVMGYCVIIPIGLIIGVRRERGSAVGSRDERANSSVG